ncbi:MAG: glycosyltransferase [Deinococcus sp.]|nr:glycosyltransferase [Deinococcus sp.]
MATKSPGRGKQALCLFAKYPAPGAVKTRLCRPQPPYRHLSHEEAAQLYDAFLTDLTGRLRHGPWDLRLCLASGSTAEQLADLERRYQVPVWEDPGTGGDLGQHLADAFAAFLDQGYTQVVILGSDVPHLAEDTVRQAFVALQDVDLVIGPDSGGGAYLLGCRRALGLFTGEWQGRHITWSQGKDCAELVARARGQGVSYVLLEEYRDIDYPLDLWHLAQELGTGQIPEALCPCTAQVVRRSTDAPPVRSL